MAILTEIQESPSSSSAAAEATAKKYDVFLSFRGEDTRLGFTDYLYEALVNESINTFLDEEEAEVGKELKPELERAIKDSRASIIVFSKNFASSTWCLDELVMILEQQKVSNHIVIPVFYNIDPSHIRKQEGVIGDALFKHKERFEAEKDEEKKIQGARKLESWKKGLTDIAGITGKNANGRREREVIKELMMEITIKLKLHRERNIPHLIGMDMSIATIGSWLKGGSSEILTISGVGGIGKTSLARYIYHLNSHKFEKTSFVENIDRKCAESTHALLDLQKELLGDIVCKRTTEEHNVDVLTSKIERALRNKHTLLVLDSVDNFEQMDVLIGTNGFLHSGSKIIVTTRDGSVTEKCALFRMKFPPKHTKHTLHGLRNSASLRLFCWHAFGGNDPKEGYKERAIKASKYCGGHPLVLQLLGCSLNNQDVKIWSEILEMLETGEFQTHVQKVMQVFQISFDSLPSEHCKELFKHIACFFVGKDWKVTQAILKECNIHTSYGIKNLMDRCLLTIGERNELKMHQLLQEMGRDLVRQESPERPWKRSRVCNHEESLYLLKEDKGTKKIQGLVLDRKMLEKEPFHGSSSVADSGIQNNDPNTIFGSGPLAHSVLKSSSPCKKIKLRTKAFRKMKNLNLLQLNYVKFSGSYKNFPKHIKCLCMHGSKLKYIPSSFPVEKLVALDMSYSNLTQLWKKPKLLGSLKILKLSYCKKLVRVCGFSGLPALERLILNGCKRLVHVCESIVGCDSLVLLNLSYCSMLKNLPSNIHKLKNLRDFPFEGCPASVFTQTVASTSSNSVAEIVPKSPKSLLISLPFSLVNLFLIGNNLFNESFPADFKNMSMLKMLALDDNPIVSLPDCVRTLSRLEVLSVEGCWELKSLVCPPSTVKTLFVDECDSLVKITLPQEISAPTPTDIYFVAALSMIEVEGRYEVLDIDDEILCSLGWTNLQHLNDHNLVINGTGSFNDLMEYPLRIICEFGIFSTHFKGKVVPNWLGHKSNGSSISLTMPSSSMNKRIQGINICFVHTCLVRGAVSYLVTEVRNVTKDRTWIYFNTICDVSQEAGEGIVWLSHWLFGNDELENGDKISVTILNDGDFCFVEEAGDGGVIVKECAVSPFYNDRENEEDPLSHYKSWKHIIGGDLSMFRLTSGEYFLCRYFNRYQVILSQKSGTKI